MPLVAVTAALLRATYLTGIPLGAAWDGATGTQRLDALIRAQIEIAESQSRLILCPRKVLTYPDPAEVRGVAYTLVGEPIPVVTPLPGEASYRIALRYPDVASVERVRLFEGMTASFPPTAVFETVGSADWDLSSMDGLLRVRVNAITAPQLAQAWAIDYTVGDGRLPAEIAEWVALGVVTEVLALAPNSHDLLAGHASSSLTLDGVVETDTAVQGTYGPYSGAITVFLERRAAIDVTQWRVTYQSVAYPTW
jgi:hypothetical protein